MLNKTLKKINWKYEIRDQILIVIGSAIIGLSYAFFLIPHHIVPGGVGGLSIVINYFTKFPVGILIAVLNIPLFIIGIKVIGKSFGIKSLIGVFISSFFIDWFTYLLPSNITKNPLLASIYGGLLLGIGLGLIFRGNASTGGSDIIGQVIKKYTNLSVGVGIMLVDFVIISLAGLSFHSFEAPLIGYVSLYVSSKVIDIILEGWGYAKMAFIITDKPDEIADTILENLNRGCTMLKSFSPFTKKDRKAIFTVVNKKEIPKLKRYIKRIDPQAFVVISDVYEVLGRGFKRRNITNF